MLVAKRRCRLPCLAVALVLLAACSLSQERDPVAVVQAFYKAASAEDIDAFMALVADDAEIEWGREGLVTGKDSIRRRAEALFSDFDFTFVLSDLQADGNRVTFHHEMILEGTQAVVERCADEVVVEDGKIKSDRIISCVYPP